MMLVAYLLKSAACMAAFLLFYQFLLEKENMHVFKRFFLLMALIASLVIPAIVFTEYVEVAPVAPAVQTNTFNAESTLVANAVVTDMDVVNWNLLLWSAYLLGVAAFGFRFIKHLLQIGLRVQRNPKLKQRLFTQVLLQEKMPPHTFFKFIFLNKMAVEKKSIPEEVILHEETHAKQLHSIDVLFIELLQVLLWFNPLIYLFKKNMKLNHEFLADSAVLKDNVPTRNYQNTLLSYLSKESNQKYQSVGVANPIVYSSTRAERSRSIKKRFIIMKKRTSKKSIFLRTLLLVPVLALLLLGFSEKRTIYADTSLSNEIAMSKCSEVEHVTLQFIENRIHVNDKSFDTAVPLLEYLKKKYVTNGYDNEIPELHFYLVNPNDINNDLSSMLPTFSGGKWYVDKERQMMKNVIDIESFEESKYTTISFHVISKDVIKLDGNVYNSSEIKNAINELIPGDVPLNKIHLYGTTNLRIENDFFKRLQSNLSTLGVGKITFCKEGCPPEEFDQCLDCPNKNATKSEINRYNFLAKKYNAVPIEKRTISLDDLKVLETIYRKMTQTQKQNAQPFPECLPKNKQQTATELEVREYNALAKKYYELPTGKSISINKSPARKEYILSSGQKAYMSEFERVDYIYGFMSDEQKESAEPYPFLNIEKWPPQESATREQMKEYNALAKKYNEMPRDDMRVLRKDVERLEYIYSIMSDKQKADAEPFPDFPEPPPPPESPKVMKGEVSDIPPPPTKSPRVLKGEVSDIPPPPAPPTPPDPLDHVIDMAKKGADFYYEGKKISSDRAIELLKKNKDLSISTSQKNNNPPIVKISKYL